jgi:hypothetical protein
MGRDHRPPAFQEPVRVILMAATLPILAEGYESRSADDAPLPSAPWDEEYFFVNQKLIQF